MLPSGTSYGAANLTRPPPADRSFGLGSSQSARVLGEITGDGQGGSRSSTALGGRSAALAGLGSTINLPTNISGGGAASADAIEAQLAGMGTAAYAGDEASMCTVLNDIKLMVAQMQHRQHKTEEKLHYLLKKSHSDAGNGAGSASVF